MAACLGAVDRWALDGHGNNRQLFKGTGNQWTVTPALPRGAVCDYPTWQTPFSGYNVAGGAALSDSGTTYLRLRCYRNGLQCCAAGTLHVPLVCTDGAMQSLYVAAFDADSGANTAFALLNRK